MRGREVCAAAALALAAWGGGASAQIADTGEAEASAAELAASADDIQVGDGGIRDPLEGFNRVMFDVNGVIDDGLLVPAAKTYRFFTNDDMRKGLRNFLNNAETPTVLLNDLLQAEFERAGETTARFLINSTIGIGGILDIAAKWGLPPHSEDFGQTLAVWGIGSGPYLYLPLFGPSSARDGVGRVVDIVTDPLFWIRTDPAQYARYSRFGATAIAFREPFIEPVEDIEEKSLDPYASFRSFYTQARKREIANGVTNYDDLPDIGEYEDLEEIE